MVDFKRFRLILSVQWMLDLDIPTKMPLRKLFTTLAFCGLLALAPFAQLDAQANRPADQPDTGISTPKTENAEAKPRDWKYWFSGTWYFEYARGVNSGITGDLSLKINNTDLTIHDIEADAETYTWWRSQTRLFDVLFGDAGGTAAGALTEPYYALRVHYYLPGMSQWGIGLEHTHFKFYLNDKSYDVQVSGKRAGKEIDGKMQLSSLISQYSISHGINHINFWLIRRWSLFPTADSPDGQLQPYVQAGLGPAVPHFELIYREGGRQAGKAYDYQLGWANWGMGLGAGARYRFWKYLAVWAEYKLTYSILHSLEFEDRNGNIGEAATNFWAHHFQFGASVVY